MKSRVKNEKLLIIGASGHGKVVADIARMTDFYQEILFADDDENIKACAGCSVIPIKDLNPEMTKEYDVVVAIGNSVIRENFQSRLKNQGYFIATLIHPAAVISQDVSIGEGTVVMAGCVVNAETGIGRGCILNTGSSVDHDCVLEDFCHVSVGAHLAGTVTVGAHTWIGMGACVNNNLQICSHCMIGSGAVVVKNISDPGTYIGVPVHEKG